MGPRPDSLWRTRQLEAPHSVANALARIGQDISRRRCACEGPLALSLSLCLLLVSIAPGVGHTEAYSVNYDPYAAVDWSSVLRCPAQHHDHVSAASRVIAYDDADYCAVMFMTYSGAYRSSTQTEWEALGSPEMDPGQPVGWVSDRRWPPEAWGAPDTETLDSIEFYVPGAEEGGLIADGSTTRHVHSPFLTTYIEGSGCLSCGIGGRGVAIDNDDLPGDRRYASSQELIGTINLHGGHATLNHPTAYYSTALVDYGSVEIFNNFMALRDEVDGGGRIQEMLEVWDQSLMTKSTAIWGVAVNDHFGAYRTPGPQTISSIPSELSAQQLDRGKIEVLVPSFDLASYREAFESGAFFAVVEDNVTKMAYPQVTRIDVTWSSISIATELPPERIDWIANGLLVATGPQLDLLGLPGGLLYVRAVISDGAGRTIYTQPFSLAVPEPTGGATLLLGLLAMAAIARTHRRLAVV